MTPDEQIRLECLKLACTQMDGSQGIVARAEAFHNFVSGGGASVKPLHSEGAVEALAEVDALLEKGKRKEEGARALPPIWP